MHTDQSQASIKTPEPTFENEPRYAQPPDTPKRSPEKRSEPNPLLKLAVILASHWPILVILASQWSILVILASHSSRCLAVLAAARSHLRHDILIQILYSPQLLGRKREEGGEGGQRRDERGGGGGES